MSGSESAPPGWYPVPNDPRRERWWDGSEWTDPNHPLSSQPDVGSPGLWVEASCAPLDKVGTGWVPWIFGVKELEDRRVEFGGGSGRLLVTRFNPPGHAPALEIELRVDRHGARCILSVEGPPEAVKRFRPEFERAAAGFVCAGRQP